MYKCITKCILLNKSMWLRWVENYRNSYLHPPRVVIPYSYIDSDDNQY